MRQILFLALLFISTIAHASENLILFDESRTRNIPVEIYEPEGKKENKVALINHGYGVKNTEYTFLAEHLAKHGFLVLSIQHDLEDDPPLPRSGDIFKLRQPFWQHGVKSLEFVVNHFTKQYPQYNWSSLVLIGHSNGGDIAMMYSAKNQGKVAQAISLDSLRHPIPTNNTALSIRADDTEADDGVLPPAGAKVIDLKGAKHIDMYDAGPEWVKEAIIKEVDMVLHN